MRGGMLIGKYNERLARFCPIWGMLWSIQGMFLAGGFGLH